MKHSHTKSLANVKDLELDPTGREAPVRGSTAMLKRDELDELEYVFDFKSKLFNLAEPDDKAMFDDVNDRLMSGLCVIRKRIDKWEAADPAPKIWLEWADVYREVPEHIARRVGYGNQ